MAGKTVELVTAGDDTARKELELARGEDAGLGRRVGAAIEECIRYYRKEYGLSREVAVERVVGRGPLEPETVADEVETPHARITWDGLTMLMEACPELGDAKWEAMKADARRQLDCGMVAADAILDETPWERAVFVAVREDLAKEWQPRNGIERTLIDQMAVSHFSYLHWQKVMLRFHRMDPFEVGSDRERQTPRLSQAEAVDRAQAMADKYQRAFLRSQRALCNMRRLPVIVQSAGQVNVGAQQVNMAAAADDP